MRGSRVSRRLMTPNKGTLQVVLRPLSSPRHTGVCYNQRILTTTRRLFRTESGATPRRKAKSHTNHTLPAKMSPLKRRDAVTPTARGTLTSRVLANKCLSPVLELLTAENTGRNTPIVPVNSPPALNFMSPKPHVQHQSLDIDPIQIRLEASLTPYILPRLRRTPVRRVSDIPRMAQVDRR